MVKDIKYIIKRVIIGVLIAIALMWFKGGLIANVSAAESTYTIYFENTTNSYKINSNTNSFLYVSGQFNRISVVNHNYNIQNEGKYELYSTITLGIDRGSSCTSSNLGLRSDFYIGNSNRTSWINPTTTWNHVDDINVGNNGYCNYTWGSVQTFTSNLSSNGITYDFYFTNPTNINYIKIDRFDLVNTGTTTGDAINNMTNQIINNQNTNNNLLIDNQNQNTQDIIDNQNQNTQDIIDNQNQNTQQEIESQKVCNTYGKESISIDNKFINTQGQLVERDSTGVTKYINIYNAKVYRLNSPSPANSTGSACFYDIDKTLISCIANNSVAINTEYTLPNGSYFMRFSLNKEQDKPQFKVCTNGNQGLNNSINDLDNSINDDSGISDDDIGAYLTPGSNPNTPLANLLTLPLQLINQFISGFSSACSPVNLGSLLGTQLIIPCIDLESKLGSNMWSIIDGVTSIFIIYNFVLLVINAYNQVLSLHDTFEDLYVPKHGYTGYKPKHGGD